MVKIIKNKTLEELEGNLRVNSVLVGRRQWQWRKVWLVLEVEFSGLKPKPVHDKFALMIIVRPFDKFLIVENYTVKKKNLLLKRYFPRCSLNDGDYQSL